MSSASTHPQFDSKDIELSESALIWSGRRVCKRITAHYARTFYFASHCLPRKTRTHAYAVYAFCRWVDNAVDDAQSLDDAKLRLGIARQALIDAYGSGPLAPGLMAFRQTVKSRRVPHQLFDDLLEGMAMDLVKFRYETWEELDLYCYRVAGVVGLMMTHVFGYDDPRCFEQAKSLGTAMQLTNILRDIGEDFDRGRLYLPADELSQFGVTMGQIESMKVSPEFVSLMQFQVDRARRYYAEADSGVRHVQGSTHRMTIRVMGHLYGLILHEIEKLGYDVFHTRAHVSKGRKIRGLVRCQAQTWLQDLQIALG